MAANVPRNLPCARPSDWCHTFSVDYGTSKIRVSYCLARIGNNLEPSQIKLLFLQKKKTLLPSRVGFLRLRNANHALHWGAELSEVVEREQLEDEDVFEFHSLKMCLYPTDIQGDHQMILQEQLARYIASEVNSHQYDLEDVITLHLEAIRKRAIVAVIEMFKRTWTPHEVRSMEQCWSFTVPEIATLATNQTYAQLIRRAGFPKGIMLMTETEAAAAYLLYEHARSVSGLPECLKEHDINVVIDAGGLTVNLSAYEVDGPVNAGAAVRFRLVTKAGLSCGSETLVKHLMRHIQDYANTHTHEHPGGFEGVLTYLGKTRAQVERHLSVQFEAYKAIQASKHITFTLEGRNKMTGQDVEKVFRVSRQGLKNHVQPPSKVLTFSRDTVRGWLREISGSIIDKLEDVLNKVDRHIHNAREAGGPFRTRFLMPTGGLLRNDIILEELHSMYRERNVIVQTHSHGQVDIGPSDPAVALGACMRTVPCDPIFSAPFALGLARDEAYFETLHGRRASYVKTVDGSYVEDRWCTLVPDGDVATCGAATKSWTAMLVYFIAEDAPTVRDTTYLSLGPIEDHDEVFAGSELRPGVQKYKFIEEHIDLDRLKTYKKRTLCGEELRQVTVKLIVTMELTQIEYKIEMVDPSFDQLTDEDDSGMPSSTALGGEGGVLRDNEFPSTIIRNPLRRPLRRPTLPSLTSPASTSKQTATASEEGSGEDSDGGDASLGSKQRRTRTSSCSKDSEYLPRSRLLAASARGMNTRATRRR